MTTRPSTSAVILAGILMLTAASSARAQNQVPPFIQVGKSYVFISMLLAFTNESMAPAEVLEIGPAPWVKVRVSGVEAPVPDMWVNMNSVDAVFEMTPEVQAMIEEQFESTKDRAYQAAMKSDLRNLVTAQEVYFSDHMTYAGDFQALGEVFYASQGVTIEIHGASARGWSASAGHADSRRVCHIFVGDGTRPVEGMEEGVPLCR